MTDPVGAEPGVPRGPVVCVGAIVTEDDDLLLVRRRHSPAAGTWSVPGGRVERGETLIEAVVRELEEETGLVGVCGDLVGHTELLDEQHAIIFDYRVHLLDRAEPVAGDDAAEARWVHRADVGEMHLAPGLAEMLHEHGFIPTIT